MAVSGFQGAVTKVQKVVKLKLAFGIASTVRARASTANWHTRALTDLNAAVRLHPSKAAFVCVLLTLVHMFGVSCY